MVHLIQGVSDAIDPSRLSQSYGLKPDRSSYYLVHTDEEMIICQFSDRGMLVTVLDNQLISRDEVDEIELIEADTFDEIED